MTQAGVASAKAAEESCPASAVGRNTLSAVRRCGIWIGSRVPRRRTKDFEFRGWRAFPAASCEKTTGAVPLRRYLRRVGHLRFFSVPRGLFE